ncbi:MAG: uridine kinase [Clostridia bacterium]|nr:uridine kinase [Clostridia bacterium]
MFVIGIAGGTCSGKSTLSGKLAEYFGERCRVIHMDAYFRRPSITTIAPITGIEYVEHNHPDALYLDRLYEDFHDAIENGSEDILIIEGLFALHLPEIREKLDLKIFVDLASDERLVRRIRRFTANGQTFDEVTSRYIDTVRFRHDEFVEPSRWHADMVVNGIAGQTSVDIIASYVDSKTGR